MLALNVVTPPVVATAKSRPLNLLLYPLLVPQQLVTNVTWVPTNLGLLGTAFESKLGIGCLALASAITIDTTRAAQISTPKGHNANVINW